MSKVVEDFKNSNGDWVYRFTDENKMRWFTRSGMLWHGLRQRTNPNGKKQKQSPCYVGVTNEFENFQKFTDWCHKQIGYFNKYCLDKDILFKGNKIYSEKTCCFVPQELNKLLTKRERCRGDFPIGVVKEGNTFRANVRVGVRTALTKCGFKTPEDAFMYYKQEKEKHIKKIAEKWKESIDLMVYEALMNYQVEMTD